MSCMLGRLEALGLPWPSWLTAEAVLGRRWPPSDHNGAAYVPSVRADGDGRASAAGSTFASPVAEVLASEAEERLRRCMAISRMSESFTDMRGLKSTDCLSADAALAAVDATDGFVEGDEGRAVAEGTTPKRLFPGEGNASTSSA